MSLILLKSYHEAHRKPTYGFLALAAAPVVAVPPVGAAAGILAGIGLIGYLAYRLLSSDFALSSEATWGEIESSSDQELKEIEEKLRMVGLQIGKDCAFIFSAKAMLVRLVNRSAERAVKEPAIRAMFRGQVDAIRSSLESIAKKCFEQLKQNFSKISGLPPGLSLIAESVYLLLNFFIEVENTASNTNFHLILGKSIEDLISDLSGCFNTIRKTWPGAISSAFSTIINGIRWCIAQFPYTTTAVRASYRISKALLAVYVLNKVDDWISYLEKSTGIDRTVVGQSLNWLLHILEFEEIPEEIEQVTSETNPAGISSLTVQFKKPSNLLDVRLLSLTLPGLEVQIQNQDENVVSIPAGNYRMLIHANANDAWKEATTALSLVGNEQTQFSIQCQDQSCRVTKKQGPSIVEEIDISLQVVPIEDSSSIGSIPPKWRNQTPYRVWLQEDQETIGAGPRYPEGTVPEGIYAIVVEFAMEQGPSEMSWIRKGVQLRADRTYSLVILSSTNAQVDFRWKEE